MEGGCNLADVEQSCACSEVSRNPNLPSHLLCWQADVPACKSVISLIDAVLLPFDPAAPPANDAYAAAAMLGARGCGVAPNALIAGQEIKAGQANRQVGAAGAGWVRV